jgi:hypothetical protein
MTPITINFWKECDAPTIVDRNYASEKVAKARPTGPSPQTQIAINTPNKIFIVYLDKVRQRTGHQGFGGNERCPIPITSVPDDSNITESTEISLHLQFRQRKVQALSCWKQPVLSLS